MYQKNAKKIEKSFQNSFKITKNNPPPWNKIEIICICPLHPRERLLRRDGKCKIKK